jgi:vanillin dehydrogenase
MTIRRPDIGGNLIDVARIDKVDRSGSKRTVICSLGLDGVGTAEEVLHEGVRAEKRPVQPRCLGHPFCSAMPMPQRETGLRVHIETGQFRDMRDTGRLCGFNDMQKAMDLALRLETGMVHINDTTVSDEPHVPFGGVKSSGMGREGGRYSMEEMTELK